MNSFRKFVLNFIENIFLPYFQGKDMGGFFLEIVNCT